MLMNYFGELDTREVSSYNHIIRTGRMWMDEWTSPRHRILTFCIIESKRSERREANVMLMKRRDEKEKEKEKEKKTRMIGYYLLE